ncbi:Reverse transcriptase domain-containing protein, partial [Aphis craccivora]
MSYDIVKTDVIILLTIMRLANIRLSPVDRYQTVSMLMKHTHFTKKRIFLKHNAFKQFKLILFLLKSVFKNKTYDYILSTTFTSTLVLQYKMLVLCLAYKYKNHIGILIIPWYITNYSLHKNLCIFTLNHTCQYYVQKTLKRFSHHSSPIVNINNKK